MSVPRSKAYALLHDIEAQSLKHAHPLPCQGIAKSEWLGIGFRSSGSRYTVPLCEVNEILNTPAITRIPGAKSWVRGLVNSRGKLIPVFDLQGYFQDSLLPLGHHFRILVIHDDDNYSGLLIEKVLGLQRFSEGEWRPKTMDKSDRYEPYVRDFYVRKGEVWKVFSAISFIKNRKSADIALRG